MYLMTYCGPDQIEAICRSQMKVFVNDRVKNIVGKGQITGPHHLVLFAQSVQKFSFSRLLTLSQTTNSRHFQTERVCRQQFQI